MERSLVRSPKWSITKEGLEGFLACLDPDRDRAGQKYEQIRSALITFFRCKGCLNPEDPADETIDRIIRRMGETRIDDVMSFARGVARHVFLELHRRPTELPLDQAPRLISSGLVGDRDEGDLNRCLGCIEESLRQLDADQRELIMQWYQYDKNEKIQNRRKLSAARGVSPETLRVQVYRIRRHVHRLVETCLKASRIQ